MHYAYRFKQLNGLHIEGIEGAKIHHCQRLDIREFHQNRLQTGNRNRDLAGMRKLEVNIT